MHNKRLYLAGRTMSELMPAATVIGLLLLAGPAVSMRAWWESFIALVLAWMAGAVAYELGQLLACWAFGVKVMSFRVGSERFAIRFRVRTVQVSLGVPVPYAGLVQHEALRSARLSAAITLAGPLTDLLLAGLALASLPVLGAGTHLMAVAAALGFGGRGLDSLLPYRTRSGRPSAGAWLLALLSAMHRVKEAQAAAKTAYKLWRALKAAELLELHAGLDDVPDRRMGTATAAMLVMVEWYAAFLPGLPREDASLAERRLTPLLRHHDLGHVQGLGYLAMAMLRLRLGGPESEAERLCDQALAVKDVPDSARLLMAAVLAVSREARGLPCEDVRTTAATLTTVTQSLEGTVATVKALLDPEATLSAFRTGDPAARAGMCAIATMLRRQGRIGELLEVHAEFGVPEGLFVREQGFSLHNVEENLLLVPGLPPEVIDQAADRVQWLLDNFPFEPTDEKQEEDYSFGRTAVEHTLALARLRQGRYAEVEPLCISALEAVSAPHLRAVKPDLRATVLATIVLARRALGQPHADLLAEAMALSRDAELVTEAAQPTPAHDQPDPPWR